MVDIYVDRQPVVDRKIAIVVDRQIDSGRYIDSQIDRQPVVNRKIAIVDDGQIDCGRQMDSQLFIDGQPMVNIQIASGRQIDS